MRSLFFGRHRYTWRWYASLKFTSSWHSSILSADIPFSDLITQSIMAFRFNFNPHLSLARVSISSRRIGRCVLLNMSSVHTLLPGRPCWSAVCWNCRNNQVSSRISHVSNFPFLSELSCLICQQGTCGSEIFIYKDTVGDVRLLEISSLPQDGVSATFTLELAQHRARATGLTWGMPNSAAYNFIRLKCGS